MGRKIVNLSAEWLLVFLTEGNQWGVDHILSVVDGVPPGTRLDRAASDQLENGEGVVCLVLENDGWPDVAVPPVLRISHSYQERLVPDVPAQRIALAVYAHEAWSGWHRYLLSKGFFSQVEVAPGTWDDLWVMPSSFYKRWLRQSETPFEHLPGSEQVSDYKEADKILAITSATT